MSALHLPADLPAWVAPAVVAAAVLLLLAVAWAVGRRARPAPAPHLPPMNEREAEQAARTATIARWRPVSTALTVVAAGMCTATALTGMWNFFGDVLHVHGLLRVVLVGVLETALVTSAVQARVALLATGRQGIDGALVWLLAALEASMSAGDAGTRLEAAFRFAIPLVAAAMWDRALAADRAAQQRLNQPGDQAGQPAGREAVAWRFTRARLAVRLRLADPVRRDPTTADRARRLAVLTRARLRLAAYDQKMPKTLAWITARPVRRVVAAWWLHRQALAAVEHLHLGSDPTVTATITTTVAAVRGLVDATHPDALTTGDHNPWSPDRIRQSDLIRSHDPIPDRRALPAAAIDSRPADPDPDDPRLFPADPLAADGGRSDLSAPTLGPDSGADPIAVAEALEAYAAFRPTADTTRAARQARATAQHLTARPDDVARLREAITAGAFDGEPTVDAVRRHLQISPNYARAARAAVLAEAATTHPDPREATTGPDTHPVTVKAIPSINAVNGSNHNHDQEEAQKEPSNR